MAKNRETVSVQNPVLLAVGSRPDTLLWRQQVGLFRQPKPPHGYVSIGEPGQSDAGGVVALTITPEIAAKLVGKTIGVAVQLEFKRPKKEPSKEQLDWGRDITRRGGVFRVIRSVADAEELIRDIQTGSAW